MAVCLCCCVGLCFVWCAVLPVPLVCMGGLCTWYVVYRPLSCFVLSCVALRVAPVVWCMVVVLVRSSQVCLCC